MAYNGLCSINLNLYPFPFIYLFFTFSLFCFVVLWGFFLFHFLAIAD